MRESKRGGGRESADSNDEEGTEGRSHERIGRVYGNFLSFLPFFFPFSLGKGASVTRRVFAYFPKSHGHLLLATFCPRDDSSVCFVHDLADTIDGWRGGGGS